MKKQNSSSPLSGITITTGSAIGAGIFSLPIVTSGMWFPLTLICLILVWGVCYLATLMLLEVNMQFEPGTSFNTLTKKTLGKGWNIFSGILIAFILYIFLYAYFSAFGNIAKHTLESIFGSGLAFPQKLIGVALGLVLAVIVGTSTKWVGRVSTILVIGLIITFVLTMSGLSVFMDWNQLLSDGSTLSSKTPFIWSGLPYLLSACAFMTVVPSLYKYYGKNPKVIKKSLFWGALFSLIIYIVWIAIIFAVIPRNEFLAINSHGGNMGDLVKGLEVHAKGSGIGKILNFFSNFAIISSFLGVGLSLFDYLSDSFKFSNKPKHRIVATCLTFLPPAIASYLFPHGFIAAIGFSGIVVVVLFFILPFIMVLKGRKDNSTPQFKLKGGKLILILVLLGGIIIGASQVLAMLGYLPTFK